MKRLLFCFLLFVGFVVSASAGVVFTRTNTAGAAKAVVTISTLPTSGHFSATIVVSGTLGVYGSFSGIWWASGPPISITSVGTYGPYDLAPPGGSAVGAGAGNIHGQQDGGGPYSPIESIEFPAWSPPTKTAQTIAVTPTAISINKNEDANFTVSGSHSVLVFNMEGAFPRLGAGPNAWGLKFTNVGIFTLTIYAEEDDEYQKSNTVSVTVTVKGFRIKLNLPANTGQYPIYYEVSQGGTYLFSTIQLAGAAAETRTFEVPAGTPVTVTPRVVGLTKDGVLWSEDAGGSTNLTPTMISPQATALGDEDVTPTNVPVPPVPTKPEVDDTKKTVWAPTDPNAAAATDNTVKEASDKIVSSLDTLNATLKAGLNVTVVTTGGTGTNSDVGTHTRLDTANGHLEKVSTIAAGGKAVADSVGEKNAMLSGWAGNTYSDAASGAQTASDGVRTSIMAAGLDGTNPIPTKGNTGYIYNINAGGGIHTKKAFSFDLNPMTSPLIPSWLHSALSWVKAIIAFTAVGMLWLDTSKKTRQAILSVCQVNREGDTVVERATFTYLNSLGASAFGMGNIGTWAGFLGVIAARFIWFSIISGFFVAAVPALVSLLENVIFDDFATYKNMVFALSSQGGQFGQLMGMVLNLAPIWTLTACFIFRVTSDTLISAGVIPLALYLRLIKI